MRKIAFGTAFFLLVVAGVFLLMRPSAAVLAKAPANAPTSSSVTQLPLDDAIKASAKFLLSRVQSDGKFIYITGGEGSAVHELRYNLIRHAGAIYALASYEQSFPDEHTRELIVRATHFLVDASVRPIDAGAEARGKKLRAVIAIPELTHRGLPPFAALGGTGLGLVAILLNERIAKGTVDPEVIRSLGEFLLYMQKPSGEFFSKYMPGKEGRSSDFLSLYYPGEALLGLALLYRWDGNEKWLKAALNGLRFLANSRAKLGGAPPDNWAMVATQELFSMGAVALPAKPYVMSDGDRRLFMSHAALVARADLQGQIVDPLRGPLRGSFNPDGRTTPTATRLEGLIAILAFAPAGDAELRAPIVEPVRLGVDFLRRSQVREGILAGGIPKAIASPSAPSEASDIRIDYVQHALSAFLSYRDGGLGD